MSVEKETVNKNKDTNNTTKKIVAGLNINELVKKSQTLYGKKEQGLASQISTGELISKPHKDEDFVVWTKGEHWKALTHLKGIPYGYAISIAGKPNSGKSTHALVFMKCAQEQNTLVILWDSERKFSAERFDNQMKGDSSSLLVVNTNNILNGSRAVASLVHSAKEMDPKVKILIVWDSVGASINSSEDNEENEDYSKQPGQTAKEVSFVIRKFNKLANKYVDRTTGANSIATLVINQTYDNILSRGQTEKGGKELQYLSSVIIQLSRKKDLIKVKNGEKLKFAIISRSKVTKNHLFDGSECISELDIVVSSDGIQLVKDVKGAADIVGWDDKDEDT